MSIDYYRLREMVWTVEDPTVYALGKSYAAEDYLEDLAPDMARELLRLRDGVEVIRDRCATLAENARAAGIYTLAGEMDVNAKALTDLLEGDTEWACPTITT